MDIADLERLTEIGIPIEDIADLLMRDVEEIREKSASLSAGSRHD